ncbi:hypothetical protein [Halodesulfovibrio spirochaetisodalis]|uniref:Uncharacterized protein n=1 Tax=Halodesulfovibrio spirochaetisodalis TaxID=1560234 RepID=A0A1B7XQ57_9BACT|nr:hypothetical protein [Halodesulfovibrio spirochaetisodalis]OBQ57635.1 hypothetical protein SP90_00945 [Halodesulfovibrio spirochaetisodalis]
MAQSIHIPTGISPSMDELHGVAVSLYQIRKGISLLQDSIALDDIASQPILPTTYVDSRDSRRGAA